MPGWRRPAGGWERGATTVRTLLFGLVFICPPFLKPFILRWLCGARVGRNVHIGWFASVMGRRIEIGDHSEIRALTLITCDGDVRIGRYSIVSSFTLAYGSASLSIGDHSYVGPQSLINIEEDVRIGSRSALGARCMLFTHGSWFPYTEGYWVKFGPITIGDDSWCAAGVFIHPGVSIGDHTFVNSRTVLSQDVPSGAVMEGFPARQLTTIDKIRRKMTPRRVDAAIRQMLGHFAEAVLRRGLQLAEVDEQAGSLAFAHRGQRYLIVCVPAEGPPPTDGDLAGQRVIYLVNRPGWAPPADPAGPLTVDFTTMLASSSRDHMHTEFCQFLKRYYGVQVEYR
jgi:acetyltransferase-like isoleucine patch superfamily enzyme